MGFRMYASRKAIRHKQPAPDAIEYGDASAISWKTDPPIRMIDPVFFMPVRVTAFGNLSIGKAEEKAAYPKPLGAPSGCSGEELERCLSGLIASKIGCLIADVLTAHKLCLSEIDAHLSVISELLYPKVQELLKPWGIVLRCFQVAGIEHSGLESVAYPLRAERVKSIEFTRQLQRGDARHADKVSRQKRRRKNAAKRTQTLSPLPSQTAAAMGDSYAKASHPWLGLLIFGTELSGEALEGSVTGN